MICKEWMMPSTNIQEKSPTSSITVSHNINCILNKWSHYLKKKLKHYKNINYKSIISINKYNNYQHNYQPKHNHSSKHKPNSINCNFSKIKSTESPHHSQTEKISSPKTDMSFLFMKRKTKDSKENSQLLKSNSKDKDFKCYKNKMKSQVLDSNCQI
mgnify:CR=1 FL=1